MKLVKITNTSTKLKKTTMKVHTKVLIRKALTRKVLTVAIVSVSSAVQRLKIPRTQGRRRRVDLEGTDMGVDTGMDTVVGVGDVGGTVAEDGATIIKVTADMDKTFTREDTKGKPSDQRSTDGQIRRSLTK